MPGDQLNSPDDPSPEPQDRWGGWSGFFRLLALSIGAFILGIGVLALAFFGLVYLVCGSM